MQSKNLKASFIIAAAVAVLSSTAAYASTNTGGGCTGNCAGSGGDPVTNQGGAGGAGGQGGSGGTGVGIGVGVGMGGSASAGALAGASANNHNTNNNANYGTNVGINDNSNRNSNTLSNRNNNSNSQGQQQGQLQGQQQGQSQSANNRQGQSQSVSNSGNSRNDNRSSASNSNSNANSGNNSSQSVNIAGDTYEAARIPVSTAYAPNIAPTAVCMGSTSAGAQGMSFGVSLGSSWEDKNCMLLEQVRTTASVIGDKETAAEMMCSVKAYADARARLGHPCGSQAPATTSSVTLPTAEATKVASNDYAGGDPIVRARLGLPPLGSK